MGTCDTSAFHVIVPIVDTTQTMTGSTDLLLYVVVVSANGLCQRMLNLVYPIKRTSNAPLNGVLHKCARMTYPVVSLVVLNLRSKHIDIASFPSWYLDKFDPAKPTPHHNARNTFDAFNAQNPQYVLHLYLASLFAAPPKACTTLSKPCTSSAATRLPAPATASPPSPLTSTPLLFNARRDCVLMYPRRFASNEFSSKRVCRAAGNDNMDALSCASNSRNAGSWAIAYCRFCDRGCAVVEMWGDDVRKLNGEAVWSVGSEPCCVLFGFCPVRACS